MHGHITWRIHEATSSIYQILMRPIFTYYILQIAAWSSQANCTSQQIKVQDRVQNGPKQLQDDPEFAASFFISSNLSMATCSSSVPPTALMVQQQTPRTKAESPPATTKFLVLGARLLNPAIAVLQRMKGTGCHYVNVNQYTKNIQYNLWILISWTFGINFIVTTNLYEILLEQLGIQFGIDIAAGRM